MSKTLTETASALKPTDSRSVSFFAANTAESKKAVGTLILDVRTVTVMTDYFVITGGQSSSQVRAIADAIEENLAEHGLKPRAVEGKTEGRWVLMDYGDLIVHILQERERNYYKLEQFWNHALIVDRDEWYRDSDYDMTEET
ncbi:MAG: ribosome silencing factor [Candidatus Obscuribacterales bacterium]|nr:ribosome silencing factor [Candidatus Obscuribacterales bacterium]